MKMSEVVKTQLEWKYKPHNYFEQPISIDGDGWNIKIDDGEAVAFIDHQVFKNEESLTEELTNLILSRFHGVQLLKHRAFKLEKCVRTDIKENGKRVTFLEVHSNVQFQASVDCIILDEDGKVNLDSKKKGSKYEDRISSLISKYRKNDKVLDHILNFFSDAISDPDDELTHLYNIRDSLKDVFGSKNEIIKNLGINKSDYDRFGKLTNYLPLNEGRHKGTSIGSLRDATQSEKNEARRIAAKFIHSYMNHLEKIVD